MGLAVRAPVLGVPLGTAGLVAGATPPLPWALVFEDLVFVALGAAVGDATTLAPAFNTRPGSIETSRGFEMVSRGATGAAD